MARAEGSSNRACNHDTFFACQDAGVVGRPAGLFVPAQLQWVLRGALAVFALCQRCSWRSL